MAFTGKSLLLTGSTQTISLTNLNSPEVTLYNLPTNTANIEFGGKSDVEASLGFKLPVGAKVTFDMRDARNIYVKGTASDYLSYLLNGTGA